MTNLAYTANGAQLIGPFSERVKRRYRVRDNKRFQEIRRAGRSYTNALLVLCALPNSLPYSRFGFSVSSRIGNAVTRNRIKRRLREAVRLRMDRIAPGWDIVFIARNPIRSADYHAMDTACARLLRRAQLLVESDPESHSKNLSQSDSTTGTRRTHNTQAACTQTTNTQDETRAGTDITNTAPASTDAPGPDVPKPAMVSIETRGKTSSIGQNRLS